jgi:hypothetical protein
VSKSYQQAIKTILSDFRAYYLVVTNNTFLTAEQKDTLITARIKIDRVLVDTHQMEMEISQLKTINH